MSDLYLTRQGSTQRCSLIPLSIAAFDSCNRRIQMSKFLIRPFWRHQLYASSTAQRRGMLHR